MALLKYFKRVETKSTEKVDSILPKNFYFILLLLYSVQHWRSTATYYAAALELPNLNYVYGVT